MKLEVGKTYVARNGELVKIVQYNDSFEYPFTTISGESYISNGKYYNTTTESNLDLISKHNPTPTTPKKYTRDDILSARFSAAFLSGADYETCLDVKRKIEGSL